MDGDAVMIVSIFLSAITTQTFILMYKIGQIEQALKDLKNRVNKVEEKVM